MFANLWKGEQAKANPAARGATLAAFFVSVARNHGWKPCCLGIGNVPKRRPAISRTTHRQTRTMAVACIHDGGPVLGRQVKYHSGC